VKRHSCTAYIEAGVNLVDLPGCRPSYAFPMTVSSGTNMFFHGPSLECCISTPLDHPNCVLVSLCTVSHKSFELRLRDAIPC
jgi:hypothetical protein